MKNKELKNKFIFIEASEIKRPTYITKREFAFNDFENAYYYTGEESLNTTFESFGIPSKYRKVAIKLNLLWPLRSEAEDYLMQIGYDINANKSKDTLIINGTSHSPYFYNRFSIKGYTSISEYKDVLEFYNALRDEELLEQYINALSNFYRLSIISEKIKTFNNIIEQYENGEYGNEQLNLLEILACGGEPKILDQMNFQELQYLANNTSGKIKDGLEEEINKRLAIEESKPSNSMLLKKVNDKKHK